jgi:flagellar biosynthesis protein FliP
MLTRIVKYHRSFGKWAWLVSGSIIITILILLATIFLVLKGKFVDIKIVNVEIRAGSGQYLSPPNDFKVEKK